MKRGREGLLPSVQNSSGPILHCDPLPNAGGRKKKKPASFMRDVEAGWLSANEWTRIMNEGSTVGVFGSVSAMETQR